MAIATVTVINPLHKPLAVLLPRNSSELQLILNGGVPDVTDKVATRYKFRYTMH